MKTTATLALACAFLVSACGDAPTTTAPEAAAAADTEAAMSVQDARAHWLAPGLIAWDAPDGGAVMLASDGAFAPMPVGRGYAAERAGTVRDVFGDAYPHLAHLPLWRVGLDEAAAKRLLHGPVVIGSVDRSGRGARTLGATRVQTGAVLDALYAEAALEAPLGVTWDGNGDGPTLSVWAPTAQSVRLRLFDEGEAFESLEMTRDEASGVWSVGGTPDWDRAEYLYEVRVFAPSEGEVVTNLVTDPYSHAVTADGERSIVVRLSDTDLMPDGFDAGAGPRPASPVDAAIYELHVRDFSISDESVTPALRGKFGAFAEADTVGTRHLGGLAEAGLTHVHLLPAFDFATVPEREADRTEPEIPDDGPAGTGQAEAAEAARATDGFNWGYDPHHYTVPEGSDRKSVV